MVLPNVEETPLLLLRFTNKAKSRLIELVVRRFEESGLKILSQTTVRTEDDEKSGTGTKNNKNDEKNNKDDNEKDSEEDGVVVLCLTATQAALEEQAEKIHLTKRTTDTNVVEHFTRRHRERFLWNKKDQATDFSTTREIIINDNNNKNNNKKQNDEDNDDDDNQQDIRDSMGLFTPHEWSLLIYRLLDSVTVLPPDAPRDGDASTELSRLIDVDYRPALHSNNHFKYPVYNNRTPQQPAQQRSRGGTGIDPNTNDNNKDENNNNNKATETSTANDKSNAYVVHGETSSSLRFVLESYELLDKVVLTHVADYRKQIQKSTWYPLLSFSPPVHHILDYYGWEIGFYFAWMRFLMHWLTFPAIIGFVMFLERNYLNISIDDDPSAPIYGLVTFLWAVLMLRFWQRQENRCSYKWGTFSLSAYERQKYFERRPDYFGKLRISPITGQSELFYPAYLRRLKYVASALVTVAMLSVAFTTMILSLNLQGYIHPESNPARWNEENKHPFYFEKFAVLSGPGKIFDSQSSWRVYMPVVLHVGCIMTLNNIYRVVGTRLTTWENHETEESYRNSLVLKRFLFEAFDCYVALFYLAFYERNVEKLRNELIAVFQVDTVRRVFLESIVPLLLRWIGSQSKKKEQVEKKKKKDDDASTSKTKGINIDSALLDELELEEYDDFDDYMEILIQLGYVTLFASAYPSASLISIFANWVEVRSDAYKLATVCQRPIPYRCSGLGMWQTLMSAMIWMSALTNCLIVGFSSDQLMQYMPDYYNVMKEKNPVNGEEIEYVDLGQNEKGWIIVFVIFGLERIMLFVGMILYFIIPDVPEDVRDEIERTHYLHIQQIEQASETAPSSSKNKAE